MMSAKKDYIGRVIYIKLLSFNQFGGGQQALVDVGAFAYTVQGTALFSPLPNVQNFVSSYVGNITYLDWDPITRDEDAVQAWLRAWVYALDWRADYVEKLGAERFAALRPVEPAPSGSVDYGTYR